MLPRPISVGEGRPVHGSEKESLDLWNSCHALQTARGRRKKRVFRIDGLDATLSWYENSNKITFSNEQQSKLSAQKLAMTKTCTGICWNKLPRDSNLIRNYAAKVIATWSCVVSFSLCLLQQNSRRNSETRLTLQSGIPTTVYLCSLISLMIPSARESVS
jgi:hypothetical protein